MATVTVKTNISAVFDKISLTLAGLTVKNKEKLLKPVMFGLIDKMTKRIHEDGRATDGGQIGTYNAEYIKYVRNNDKTGIHRGASKKIIVSLTTQLENSWTVIDTPKGYGIGFSDGVGTNEHPGSIKKARFVEKVKGKKIFSLSQSEIKYSNTLLNQLITKEFHGG